MFENHFLIFEGNPLQATLKILSSHHKIFITMKRLVFLLPIAFSGCFFGTFQTSEPVKPGEIDGAIYMNMPAYLSGDHKNQAIYARQAILPYFGGFIGMGALDNLSLGVTGSLLGIGPYAKWTAYKHRKYEAYLSLVPKLYIDVFFTTTVTPQLDVIWGARANNVLSWYVFYQVLYSWEGGKVIEPDTFRIPGEIRRLRGFHQYVGFGVDLTGKVKGQRSPVPLGLRLEIGGSYFYGSDGKYYPFINLGVGLTGGLAAGLIGYTAQNPQCCYIGALAYAWMLNAYLTPTEDPRKKPKKETGKEEKEEESQQDSKEK